MSIYMFKKRNYLVFLIFLLAGSCHDFSEHPMKTDEELGDPGIADITVNDSYEPVLWLEDRYGPDCELRVERQDGDSAFAVIPFRTDDSYQITDTAIDKEASRICVYRYRVFKNGYQTGYSNEYSYYYKSQTLNRPSDLYVVTRENQGIEVHWTDHSRTEDGYILERNDGAYYREIARLGANSEYFFDSTVIIQPLAPVSCTYRLTAYRGSKQSIPVLFQVSSWGIGGPSQLRITQPSFYICALSWKDNSFLETGYEIERKTGGNAFSQIRLLPPGDTVFTDTLDYPGDYHYRVRALSGTMFSSYSNEAVFHYHEKKFMDRRDGKFYKLVTIGNQVWMAENLNYDTANGTGSWYYNDSAAYDSLGRYYNWYTARKAAPPGWHLPSMDEISALLIYFNNNTSAAFQSLVRGGSSGFDFIPAGRRNEYGRFGGLHNPGWETGGMWTSNQGCFMEFFRSGQTGLVGTDCYLEVIAYNVRCIKD